MESDANFLMILTQRLEQITHRSHLDRLPHPVLGLEEAVTPLRETFATSIGIMVNATVGSTAHSDIRRTPIRCPQTLPEGLKMKILRTQH